MRRQNVEEEHESASALFDYAIRAINYANYFSETRAEANEMNNEFETGRIRAWFNN